MRLFLLVVLFCCQLMAQAAANVPLMPVRDLQPGMQGIGRTVISGETIEDFNVEILGVTGNDATGYSIFARLYGDLIDKTGGVAQGMSGSPVYVDGRLVGAVAYGKTFNDPHYCFLTPIGKMLPLLDEYQQPPADWLPKGTALMAGGFSDYGLEYLREKLAPFGLDAISSGAVSDASSSAQLEPGSSVGVALLQGDMTLGALGTVTWTDDEGRILAFGHSFMQRGNSNFFMNKVWVLGVVPNMQSGYKVGSLREPIGKINQDRGSGIGGTIGQQPDAVPLFITANDASRGQAVSMRLRLIEDEQLAPAIVDAAVVNTLSKAVDRSGGGTAKVHFNITGVDSKKQQLVIDRDNMFYSRDALLKNLDAELIEAVTILMQNKFEPVEVYGINVEAELSEQVQVTEIQSVKLPNGGKCKPGDRVPVTVTLKPYRGEEFTRTVYFKVPKDQKSGRLALNVRGGSSMAWALQLLRKQQQEEVPAAKKQEKRRTLADFVKGVNEADKNNELIIDLASSQLSMNAESATNDAGLAGLLQGSPLKQKYPCDFIVDGEAEVTLRVE